MSIRFLPPVLIAVFIALVAVGGATLAFGRGGADSEATDDLLERAAGELGVESQALKDALQAAQSELVTERQLELLADLVENDVITQEQSDEASVWLSQKPASVDRLLQPDILIGLAAAYTEDIVIDATAQFHMPLFGDDVTGRMAEILGIDSEALENALENARDGQSEDRRAKAIDDVIARLVEDGEITQAEGDEIKTWIESMPEWLGDQGIFMRIFSVGFGGGFRTFGIDGASIIPGFKGPLFGDEPFRAIPELEELRRRGEPFFFAPGDAPGAPRFDFRVPDRSDEGSRFYYRGPEGEFDFDGEIPDEYKELFDDLNERFREGHGFEGFEELFEGIRPFVFPHDRELPEESTESTSSIKGA